MEPRVLRREVLLALFGASAGCLGTSSPGEEPDDPNRNGTVSARGVPMYVEVTYSNPDVTYREDTDTVGIESGGGRSEDDESDSGSTYESLPFEEWAVTTAGLEAARRLRRELADRLTDEEMVGLSTGLGGPVDEDSGFRLVVSLETRKDERGDAVSTPNASPEDIAGDVPERVDVDFEFDGRSLEYSYDVLVESVTESSD